MATYSTNLALTLINTGDQAGTWGVTTNTNLGTLLEQAISGYVTQAITDGADTTITIPNGATGVARNMYIECTGTLTANRNLVVPANKKLYFIYNNTSGGFAVTVKVSGQTGVSVPNGEKKILVSNGTDIVEATSYSPLPSSLTLTTLTATSANITTLTGTTFSPTTLTATSANITTLTGTNFSATSLTLTNALKVAEGGTGVDSTPTNGQLLIGNGTGFALSTLTAGSGVSITNGGGSITVASTISTGDITFSSATISSSVTNQDLNIVPNGTGELNINTTSPLSTGFCVNIASGNGKLYGAIIKTTDAAREGLDLWNSATSGNNIFVGFGTEASFTPRGSITYNRAAGQVAYNTTSDRRAKIIEGPVTNSGQVIDALSVYTGRMMWADINMPMMIADEAMQVTPYCVTGEPNAVDEKGNPIYQQMDYSALVPLLLAEIQSLRSRVAALEGS